MMNKKAVGLGVSILLLAVIAIGIFSVDWGSYTDYDSPQQIIVLPSDDPELDIWTEDEELKENSLSYVIFEKYGIVLLPLALLMFGAMVGGVVISREEVELNDSN
jgi:NADH:ubiquinone oxidoreductase subunit 6 (subunit J)